MQHTKNLFALLAVLTIAAAPKQATAAFHFSAVAPTGQTLYYKIIADSTRQVKLTYPQVSDDHENYYYGYPKPTGVLVVPDSVEHEGVWYRVTQMSGQVFWGCDSLTELTLPSTISEISLNAFFGCTRLAKVNMPSSIEEIQSNAFRECSSLESIDLPEGLRVIWGQAFCLCTSLRSVHLPSTLEEIKPTAFSSSDAIDTVWIAATVPPLCGDSQYPQWPAFTATGSVLVVPCGTEQAYGNAYGWQDFAEIISDCNGTFQSYFAQEITVWNAVGTYYDCPWENYLIRIAGDTVVDQQNYRKAEYSHVYWRGGYDENRVSEYDLLLREDRSTGRLWGRYLDEEEDFLIADMSLSIGDTFYMRYTFAYGDSYDITTCIVQDILTVDSRRTIILNDNGYYPQLYYGETLKFVEGIGCSDMSYLRTGFALSGPLVCCHKDGELVYHQPVQGFSEEDCIIRAVGIDNVDADNIKVYSRDGRIVVEGADGETVHIFDMMGRTIHNEALPTGIYLVRVGDHPARKVAVIR